VNDGSLQYSARRRETDGASCDLSKYTSSRKKFSRLSNTRASSQLKNNIAVNHWQLYCDIFNLLKLHVLVMPKRIRSVYNENYKMFKHKRMHMPSEMWLSLKNEEHFGSINTGSIWAFKALLFQLITSQVQVSKYFCIH